MSHGDKSNAGKHAKDTNLPPLVASGGQWMQSIKSPLLDEHYRPMQPVVKAKRRHTLHNKLSLFAYLENRSKFEIHALKSSRILPRTVYMDGVFDLFHVGHLKSIEQAAKLGDRVVVGITGDEDASGYKRQPIMSQADRTAIVKSLKVVDDVVCPCPLLVTEKFMRDWGIDVVVHGFANQKDKDRQMKEFFRVAMEQGKFQEIEYYSKLSTTDIIHRIRADKDDSGCEDTSQIQNKIGVKPKWFGAALSQATNKSPSLQYGPFPLELRIVIEPQLRKATKKRSDVLNAIKEATGADVYEDILNRFSTGKFAQEGTFDFDKQTHQMRENFLQSCSLSCDFDLSRLHESTNPNFKDEMQLAFSQGCHDFQKVYDDFVRLVCCPFVASLSSSTTAEPIKEVYYQTFPCVRVVRPGDFSIGPHADSTYGHHPCSINFYIPLTMIKDCASLFLESFKGSEDWHPIEGHCGMVKHFAGALCAHWTSENNTDFTRVSLDFRIIPAPSFHALKCGGKQPSGVRDVYREKEGYYSRCCCRSNGSEWIWERKGPLQTPDTRFGYPWTKFKPNPRSTTPLYYPALLPLSNTTMTHMWWRCLY